MVNTLKEQLRRQSRQLIKSFTAENKHINSVAIVGHLKSLPYFTHCQMLLAYVPLNGEPNILPLLETALEQGKEVALPRVEPLAELSFHLLPTVEALSQLEQGPYRLQQPSSLWPAVQPCNKATLLLVPGLLFTITGGRLGRGGGYYDRFLQLQPKKNLLKVGLCFESQLTDSLPQEKHDQQVDLIVTERALYWGMTPTAKLAKLC